MSSEQNALGRRRAAGLYLSQDISEAQRGALGGKTIAEVGSNGVIGDTFVYSGGARIATQHHYSYSTPAIIETTNPVTGAAITTDANASYPTRQEPDPLGRDLVSPPEQGLVSNPISGALKDQWMPIEYTGGPSQDYLDANAAWDSEMRFQTWLYQTDYFKHKNEFINAVVNQRFDEAAQILAKNPNFFVEINGKMTAGQDAAKAFTTALAKLPGDPLGMNQGPSASVNVVGGTMGAPQNSGQTKEPCPPVPDHPADADINKNIATAERHGAASVLNPAKAAIDTKNMIWFYNQIRNKGPWDYKQQGKRDGRNYQDFGNFNFGATGLATGLFNEDVLLVGAGQAQIAAGTSKPEWGYPPSFPLHPRGQPPYGDDPADQEQIKKGFAYYYAVKRGCQ